MSGPKDRTPVSTPTLAQMTGFPGWRVLYSIPIHCVLLAVLIAWHSTPSLLPPSHRERSLPQRLADITPLPALINAGSEGESGKASTAAEKGAQSPDGENARAQTYYGVQHIVSTPPNPDNSLQTVLQPDLPSPPKLPKPVPLPNMVKLAMPRSLILPSLPQVKVTAATPPQPVLPSVQRSTPVDLARPDATALLSKSVAPPPPQPLTEREAPRLPVSPSSSPALETVVAKSQPPSAPVPAAHEVKPTETAVPKAASTAKTTSPNGKDDRNILVVNALPPADANANASPPPGELHGAFEVVPSLLPQGGKQSPGASSSATQAVGRAGSPGATESAAAGSGKGSALTGAGTSRSTGTNGSSSGEGHSNGSDGHGTAGASITRGSGSGERGSSTGSGGGTGTQSGPFPNVTVEAKKEAPDPAPKPAPADPPRVLPHHEAYGMTIISSGSTGGGLRDYGVFRDGGPTYTIYLDVSSIGVRSRWSLQYGLPPEVRQAHHNQPLAPPYAVKEVLPQFPSQLVTANTGRLMVVQAQLSAEGKLEDFHVLQSPDPRLSVLLQDCLMKWIFQAATIGEEAVPVQVLLGIPIASIMAQSVATVP